MQSCSRARQLSLNAVTARSGFIAEPQFAAIACQLCNQRLQGSRRVRDLAILAHFIPLARLGERHRNRILVHIQPDVRDRLLQDPSPMHEARHRPSGATLDNLHTVRRVALSQANIWSRARRRLSRHAGMPGCWVTSDNRTRRPFGSNFRASQCFAKPLSEVRTTAMSAARIRSHEWTRTPEHPPTNAISRMP